MNGAYHTMEINMAIKKNEVDLYLVFRKEVLIHSVEKEAGLSLWGEAPMPVYPCIYRHGCLCMFKMCRKTSRKHPIEIQCKPHM